MDGIELQVEFLLGTAGSNARLLNGDGFGCGQKTDGDTEKLGELHFEGFWKDQELKSFDCRSKYGKRGR